MQREQILINLNSFDNSNYQNDLDKCKQLKSSQKVVNYFRKIMGNNIFINKFYLVVIYFSEVCY
jgi:hypothetical protein